MKVDVRSLMNTPVVEEISHSILNKATQTKIKIDESLKLMLTQPIYSFFLRCLDLNINFTDEMQHKFCFNQHFDVERMYMNEMSAVAMMLDVYIKHLSICLLDVEIFYDNANINYVDKGFKEIKIWSTHFYILQPKENDRRDVVAAPIKSKDVLFDNDLYKLSKSKNKSSDMEVYMKPNGDKSIIWNIQKIKMFIQPYLFNSVFAFFTEAFPDYDHSADKPNGYFNKDGTIASKDPGSKMTFIVDIQKSVFLFTDGTTKENSVVCDGHLNFNFHRENYQE